MAFVDQELAKRVSVPSLPVGGNFSVNKFLKTRGVGLTVEEVSSVYPNRIRTVGSDNCDFDNVQDAIDDIKSYVSTVDVNGTVVTWKSGAKFTDPLYYAPGMQLFLNMYNVTPKPELLSVIATVDSDTQLTIETSLGTLTDVSCGAGPGQYNRYAILLYPGTYRMGSALVLKDGVDIVGLGGNPYLCQVFFDTVCTEMFNYNNTFDLTFSAIPGSIYFYSAYFVFGNTVTSGHTLVVFKNTSVSATGYHNILYFRNSIVAVSDYGPTATYDSETFVFDSAALRDTHLYFDFGSSFTISTGWINPTVDKVLMLTGGQFRFQNNSRFTVNVFGKNVTANFTAVDVTGYNDVFITDSYLSISTYLTRVTSGTGTDIFFRAIGNEANIVMTNVLVTIGQGSTSGMLFNEMYFMYWRSPSQMDSDSYNVLNHIKFVVSESSFYKRRILLSDNRFTITEIANCQYPGFILEGDGRRYISYDFSESTQQEPVFNSGAYQGDSVLYARGNHRHGVPRLPFTFSSKAPTNPRQGDIWIESETP